MYLQCPSKKSRTATILFYAVCLLYVLSTITFAGDLVACIIEVSEYSSICENIIFLSVVQLNIQSDFMLRLLLLIQITLSGCCDFIAQCIIVCINHCHHPLNSRRSSKIYRCWIVWGQNIGVVIILGNRILRSVNLSSCDARIELVASSYMAGDRRCTNTCTWPIFLCYLDVPDDPNKFRPVHDCPCPGDMLDCVQNPKSVLGK